MSKESDIPLEHDQTKPLPGDNPIKDKEYDVLQRTEVAELFSQQILDLDATEGATVGLFGPWGSGKTSFINLARENFSNKDVPVLDFNPWLFSGVEELVRRFFEEVSRSMGMNKNLKDIGEAFATYGTALGGITSAVTTILGMPQIGVLLKDFVKISANISQPETVTELKMKVELALTDYYKKNQNPIIVVLDDVDRLSVPEIREVFKLVRLTASFPNLIYVVCCDRLRIEQALDEIDQGLSGRDYLEKIIQLPFNLPEIPNHLLAQQTDIAIENALVGISNFGPFHEEAWLDISEEIIRPLIRNVRDIKRYAIAIRPTLDGLNGQVALEDVLALEAVRVFLPDIFSCFPRLMNCLTVVSDESHLYRRPTISEWYEAKYVNQIKEFMEVTNSVQKSTENRTSKEIVRDMIERLFPIGAGRLNDKDPKEYLVEHNERFGKNRVSHENYFRFYLERVVSPDLMGFNNAEQALNLMNDHDRLDQFFRSLEPARWRNILLFLSKLVDQTHQDELECGIVVILNLWPDMPCEPFDSKFTGDNRTTVRIVAKQLLYKLSSSTAEDAVRRIMLKVSSLSSKLLVIRLLQRNNASDALISETAEFNLKQTLWNEIQDMSADDLAKEPDLFSVLFFAKDYGESTNKPFNIKDSPKLTFTLLLSARGLKTISSLGTRAAERNTTLIWKHLFELFDDKEFLSIRVNKLKVQFETLKPWIEDRMPFDDARKLLKLAEKYLKSEPSD